MSLLHLDELGGLTLGGLVRAHREELSFAVASAAQIQALPWKHTETDIRLKGVVQPAWPFLIRFKGVEVIRIMGWTEGGGSCITSQVVEMNYGRGLVFTPLRLVLPRGMGRKRAGPLDRHGLCCVLLDAIPGPCWILRRAQGVLLIRTHSALGLCDTAVLRCGVVLCCMFQPSPSRVCTSCREGGKTAIGTELKGVIGILTRIQG